MSKKNAKAPATYCGVANWLSSSSTSALLCVQRLSVHNVVGQQLSLEIVLYVRCSTMRGATN